MAVIKLPNGRTITVEDDEKKAGGTDIKLPGGRTINSGTAVDRSAVSRTPVKKVSTPAAWKGSGVELPKVSTPAPSLPKLPKLPKAGGSNKVSSASADLGAGKTKMPEAPQPADVTRKVSRPKQYGIGFNQKAQQPETKKGPVSSSMPVNTTPIPKPKDRNSGAMYQTTAVKLGIAQGVEDLFDAGRAAFVNEIVKRDNQQKTDFVGAFDNLSRENGVMNNLMQVGANLGTNLQALQDRTPGTALRRWVMDELVITDELARKSGYANKEEYADALVEWASRSSDFNTEIQDELARRGEGRSALETEAAALGQGVGRILMPAAAGLLIPGAGKAIIGAQSYGSGTMEALREGESIEDAQNRGLLRAGTEVGAESLFGGIPGLSGLLTRGPVFNRVGEGLEGVLETAVDAPIRRATGDEQAESARLGDYLRSFGQGVALSTVMNLPGDVARGINRLSRNGDYYRPDPGENETAAREAGQLDRTFGDEGLEGRAVIGQQGQGVTARRAAEAAAADETGAEQRRGRGNLRQIDAERRAAETEENARREVETEEWEFDAQDAERAAAAQNAGEGATAEQEAGRTNLPQTERRAAWDYADRLKKDMNIEMGSEQLRGEIEQLFAYFKNNGWTDEGAAMLKNLARKLVTNSAGVMNVEASLPARRAKSYLRNTQIGVTPAMKAELEHLYGNYNAFRKKHMGRLNLKLVEDGTAHNSVDMLYSELSEMAPEWFPPNEGDLNDKDMMAQIVWFADQDTDVYDQPFDGDIDGAADWMAAQILQGYAENYRQTAYDFRQDVEVHRAAREAQKELEAVEKQARLTNEEKELVRDMVNGRVAPEMVRDPRLRAVYEARVANYSAQRAARATKANRRQQYKRLAQNLIETVWDWKDKKFGLAYSTETAERNIRDIVPDERVADEIIERVFRPVHENEAAATRMKNRLRQQLGKWKLGTKAEYEVQPLDGEMKKYSESALVQMYGEGKITDDQVRASGASLERVAGAAADFRSVYDELLDMANEALVRNGFAPVEKRANYFPHFAEPEPSGIRKVLSWMGIKVRESGLPTDIAGMSDLFRPGKKYVANFNRRMGNKTDYDALKGFDMYIDSVADVIFHTDDIQRLRALEHEIRYQAGSDGVQERVNNILDDPFMDEDAKTEAIRKIFEEDKSHLGGFVTWLQNYTNTLAGKKSFSDRDWEHKVGRGMYDVMTSLEGRIGANMVGGNISSAFTNFIPIFQGLGEVPVKYMAQALKDVATGVVKEDGFAQRSDFLTNRKGTDRLHKTRGQQISDIAATPFSFVDGVTSETLVRARYLQNIDDGMEASLAMQEADQWAAGLMADRSKGALPIVFNEKNPIAKALNMFQVEVNNQYRYMLKDLPRNMQDQGKAAIAGALFKLFLASGLYGELFEQLAGYDPTFNPLGILKDTVEGLADEEQETGDVLLEAGTELAGQVPFVGNLLGGGRIPVGDVLSTAWEIPTALYKGAVGKTSPEKMLDSLGRSALDLGSVTLLPFGGNQLKKTGQGVAALARGRVSSLDNEGNEELQYLVDPTPGNIAKGVLVGKWSFPEAKEYVEGGFKRESAENTQVILRAPDEARIDSKVAKNVVDNLRGKKAAEKREYIYAQPGLDVAQKAWLEHELLASDKKKANAELALTRGIPLKTFYWVAANGGNQDETERALNRAIGLDRKQKEWLWSILTGGADKNNPYK